MNHLVKISSTCLGVMMVLLACLSVQADNTDREEQRHRERREAMVRDQIEGRDVTDPRVLEAMRSTPRHLFVPENRRNQAYQDRPLPIGHGQTISQPYIVAFMTEVLQLEEGDKVLEIGTGSGYHAAVLAEIIRNVYSREIIDPLAENGEQALRNAGYGYVEVKKGDGYYGWEAHAPFDAIIVTAAAGHIPPPLIEQLKRGGRMVIPVGGVYQTQVLMLITKDMEGEISTERLMMVRFVPMTGAAQE